KTKPVMMKRLPMLVWLTCENQPRKPGGDRQVSARIFSSASWRCVLAVFAVIVVLFQALQIFHKIGEFFGSQRNCRHVVAGLERLRRADPRAQVPSCIRQSPGGQRLPAGQMSQIGRYAA